MIRSEFLPFGRPNISDAEIDAVARVMRSGWIGMGQETIAFERELAEYLGAPFVVTVNSCTSALFLSLLVLGIKPGDEVACPSLTWCATANAALYLGAKPVFCDVDPDTLNLTPESVAPKLTPRTRAVVVVHFGGLAVDVDKLRMALPPTVAIVEDAAHALGARFQNGRRVGSSGNLTCFSFYANKNVSTGEGGAVALSDASIAERLRSMSQNALSSTAWKRYTSPNVLTAGLITQLGYKMNYTDLQSAIGRVQLARQDELAAIRLTIAREYVRGLEGLVPPLHLQRDCTQLSHSRHLFIVRVPKMGLRMNRNELLVALRERNIGATIHYIPLHLMDLYRDKSPTAALPVTDQIAETILTLPISASMSPGDAKFVTTELIGLLT